MPHKSHFVHALKAASHTNDDGWLLAAEVRTNYKAF